MHRRLQPRSLLHLQGEEMSIEAMKQEPPPECQTEAEKTAYAFGWWKAMDYVRQNGIIGETK